MTFEWDEDKNSKNDIKHGIRFEEAVFVFEDPMALEMRDPYALEERYVLLGASPSRGILVVVYCERYKDIIRIISARKATKLERRQYEE